MTLDPELKSLMTEVRGYLNEGNKIKAAVTQLEEQMRGIPSTLENKLAAVRSTMYDARGRYRGVFPSEIDARAFGLMVMSNMERREGVDKITQVFKSEFKDLAQRAMGSESNSAGGSLVPVEFSNRIERLVEDYGVWAANAFPMPMNSGGLNFARRTGGVQVFITGEDEEATDSEPGFSNVELTAKEWNTLTYYPVAMEEDAAAAVGEMIAIEIAQAFSEKVDDCGFVGDGTKSSLHVLGITTRLKTINGVDDGGGLVLGTGNAWSELTEDDFLKVMGRTPRYAARNGKWYCSNTFFWTVMAKITLSKGGVTATEFAGRRALNFLGYPVEITQSMPAAAANSQVCALFGDLRLSSTLGRRKDLTIARSTDAKFTKRQIAVLATQRHAIANHSLGKSDAAGPIVGLITAAS